MTKAKILDNLAEIAKNIKLDFSDFKVSYSDFAHLDISLAEIKHLKRKSEDIQKKFLILQIMDLIYKVHYEGSILKKPVKELETNENFLEKVASQYVDWEFYKRLESNNYSKGWFHTDMKVIAIESDESLVVQYDGLNSYINKNRHLKQEERTASVGDFVSVLMPPSGIEEDLYIVTGEAEINFYTWKNPDDQVINIYFNFEPEAAIFLIKNLTKKINPLKIPFVLKVLHNPLNYYRYDSGRLRIHKRNYDLVKPIIKDIYLENNCLFGAKTPIFTKQITKGIGLSEFSHPKLLLNYGETVGINCCYIVANALAEAHFNGEESLDVRIKYIMKYFEKIGIDLYRPYINPDSEDIYTPLDVD